MNRRTRMLLCSACLLALAALLAFAAPAFAEGEPPPEAPAAPPPAPQQPDAPTGAPAEGELPADEPAPITTMDLLPCAGGDPWFKVGSITYRFMFAGGCAAYGGVGPTCSESASPISAALAAIDGGLIPSDRYLYLDGLTNYPESDDIIINGVTQPNLGQLRGVIGGFGYPNEPNTPTSVLAGRIDIYNMSSGFYLKGLYVASDDSADAPIIFWNNSGTIKMEDVWMRNLNAAGTFGLIIDNHNGSIDLNRVRVNQNPRDGAHIYTNTSSGSIKITNSAFDRNGTGGSRVGLTIQSDQNITLDGVTASLNYGDGLAISRNDLTLSRTVTIKNSTFYKNDNNLVDQYGQGIYMSSAGTVTMTNLYLDENEKAGLTILHRGNVTITHATFRDNENGAFSIDTCLEAGGECTYAGSGKVTLTDLIMQDNPQGLGVYAKGAISARYLDAYLTRATFLNQYGSGNITIQYSSFDAALGGTGLEIYSAGSVSLKDVDVTKSGSYGLYVDATNGHGSVQILGGKDIINEFSDNTFYGMYIQANGLIALTNIQANGNGDSIGGFRGPGARLNNDDDGRAYKVVITNSTFNQNYGSGLFVKSLGAITLNGVSAYYNLDNLGVNDWDWGDGIRLDNSTNTYPVSISNYGDTNSSASSNDGFGLYVAIQGSVTVKNSYFYGNRAMGIRIWVPSVTVKTVSLTDVAATFNSLTGISITSNGAIALTDIRANDNGTAASDANGAYLENTGFGTTGTISVKDGYFNNNYGNGLHMVTEGAILVSNTAAYGNYFRSGNETGRYYGHGIRAWNETGTRNVSITASHPQEVYVEGESISANQGAGVWVRTQGAILIKNLAVTNSGIAGGWTERGVFLENDFGTSSASVTVTGLLLDNNQWDNLSINSQGSVSISSVGSTNPIGGRAISIENSGATSAKGVTLTNCLAVGTATGNGVHISSNGAITVTNIIAASNPNNTGLYLSNSVPGYASPVTIKSSGSFLSQLIYNNRAIEIYSRGVVSVSTILVTVNQSILSPAVYIKNDNAGTVQKVTVTKADFIDNLHTGLMIESLGVITLTSVNVSGSLNDGHGAHILNHDINSTSEVKVTKSSFSNNLGFGLWVTTLGKITLDTVDVEGNTSAGMHLLNNFGASTAPVSIKNVRILTNRNDGLVINTNGNVTISSLTANANDDRGLVIDADGGTGKVTLSKIETVWNGLEGLIIYADNDISINKAEVNMNGLPAVPGLTVNGAHLQALGHDVTIKNGNFRGNHSYGIYVNTNNPTGSLLLINTQYFGNHHYNVIDLDLYWD